MRSRAVAVEMQRLGHSARLLVLGDDSSLALLRHTGLPFEYCQSDSALVQRVSELGVKSVVFDMLRFDRQSFGVLRKNCRTVSLSPVFDRLDEVEFLFHRTRYCDPRWRTNESFPEIYCGLEYAIISERCHRIPSGVYRAHLKKSPLSIAISMGGADAANRTLTILEGLKDIANPLLIWVALGEAYTHSYEELVASVRGTKHEVILVKSNESMWRVLQNSCLLICASGVTSYEAAFVGLPSIVLPENEAGEFLVRELEENGACRVLRRSLDQVAEVRRIVQTWDNCREQLLASHQATKGLIKGDGARRVARRIA